MVEFKKDTRDGQFKLMEINPKFWGSLDLAIAAGVDFPYLAARMAAEGDIDPVEDYRVGVRFRWVFDDAMRTLAAPGDLGAFVRDFFDRGASDYDAAHYGDDARSFMTDRLRCMLDALDTLGVSPAGRFLDAGCGPGRLVMALAGRGFEVRAVDTSHQMLARTRANLADAKLDRVELAQASIEALPFPDESFDWVASAGVIEYAVIAPPTLEGTFGEIATSVM